MGGISRLGWKLEISSDYKASPEDVRGDGLRGMWEGLMWCMEFIKALVLVFPRSHGWYDVLSESMLAKRYLTVHHFNVRGESDSGSQDTQGSMIQDTLSASAVRV